MKQLFLALSLLAVLSQVTLAPTDQMTKSLSDNERAEAYYEQGYTYYVAGDYKSAGPEFVKSINLAPKSAKSHYWLGKVNYKLGKFKTSIANCDTTLSIDPGYSAAKVLKKEAQLALIKGGKQTLDDDTALFKPIPVVKPTVKEEVKPVTAPVVREVKEQPIQTIKAKKNLMTLDLRNVDISSVLQIFSKETGLDIIAGRDVYGKVTVVINNMDPDDALDMILRSNGFTYVRDGNVIRVFSSGDAPRIEELPDGSFVRSYLINYVTPDDLMDTLKKLMPDKTSIYTTKGSKAIIVKGSAGDLKRAEVLIRNLDIPPKQVMVESKIIEISVNEGQSSGVNAEYTNPNNATEVAKTAGFASPATAAGASGLYYNVTNNNITALVNLLSTRTGFNILSSPKVLAMNDQTAQIITGSRLGYKVKTVTTTGMVESIEFMDVGTKLVITPSIKSDGMIVMEIHPEISEGSIVGDLPQKYSTETTTKLIVRDGQTVVIGGLVRDTQKKEVKGVPILMDLWVVGWMFKRTDITSEKKEVIVLITPHIMNSKLSAEMEDKAVQIEKHKRDITPIMNLDLIR